jgi:hypothetical protein
VASLTPAVLVTAGSVAIAAAVVAGGAAWGAPGLARPVFAGLAGPLIAVVATWVLVVRGYRRDPAGLSNLTVAAFFVKLVFFIAYVAVAIKVAGLPVRSFGISFVTWFIALYAVEAVLLARLFREGPKGVR